MGIFSTGRRALAFAAALAGLGALAATPANANPENPAFGQVRFHQGPTTTRLAIEPRQVHDHPGQDFANWRGFMTFPEFTAAQKQLIAAAKSGGGAARPGGGGGGGGGGGTATIPYWESQITSPLDSKTYTMSMVGTNPYTTSTVTTITYVPIVLVATVGKNVYDPTKPGCGDTVSVADRFFNSPLFKDTTYNSNGVSITDQFASAFQRANFWSTVGSKSYGVRLAPSVAQPIVVNVSLRGTTYNVSCPDGSANHLAAVAINTFDSAIRNVIAQYSTPTQLPIVLTYNIVESQNGQCCILGYHNAVAVTGGVQTYATGAYVDDGIFNGTADISVWSHEITEWLDDPFVQASVAGGGSDDLTPSWGHIGQVGGCQNNLEVGDPLSGTEYTQPYNGFTYHYQDLAYKDWFYRTPSEGTSGRYSFVGQFTTTQGPCV
jgi:hypothetical protein